MKAIWMCTDCRTRHTVEVKSDDDALIVVLDCDTCGRKNSRRRKLTYNCVKDHLVIVQERQLERR